MIEIAGRKINITPCPFFVADIGSNWDGSRTRALEFVDIAAEAGANAVKYQGFAAEAIVSRRGFSELGQIGHQAKWDKDVYATYESAALPLDWVPDLAKRCESTGIAFMCTAYSPEIVDAVDPFVAMHKVGSGDITWIELLQYVASKGKPVLLGTGASSAHDVSRAYAALDLESRLRLVLLQCNSDYGGDPAIIRHTNLRVLQRWERRARFFHTPLGLSDHSPGHLTVCAAIALGAKVFEKHLTDDRTRPGPDHAFAMEPQEWREMITAARQTWEALGDGVKKVEANEREAAIVQRRALRYREDLRAGIELDGGDVISTRPCPPEALEPYRIGEIMGRSLKRDVEADTLVQLEDFE